MMDVLAHLEPRREESGTQMVNELDEFNEIVFIQKGVIAIGYEINKIKRHCIRYKDRCVVGGFGSTFNQRASYIYTAVTSVEGYFIRKYRWRNILNEYSEIAYLVRQNILLDYLVNIRSKVNCAKRKDKKTFMRRHDHQYMLTVELKAETQ